MYDLLLKGGRIYDGSGMPSYQGDVGIKNGKIVEIGRLKESATRTLNVDGLAVAPGFIDPHTHFDAQLFWDPLGTSSCFHGVTSVVLGNCGLSLAPAKAENRDAVIKSFVRVEAISRKVLEEGVQWKWISTAEYLNALGSRLGINAAALIGHIAVRHYVMGEEAVERQATAEEIAEMKDLVRQGMEAGAVGFSTNQNSRHIREDKKPVASRLASDDELGSLLDVLGEMNSGVVQLSGGGADSRGRIAYAAAMARRTGRPVLWQSISHSWSRPNHWQEMERVFKEEGLPIYAMTQAKPFQNRYTLRDAQCFDEFPTWKAAMFSPLAARRQMFADRGLLRAGFAADVAVFDPATVNTLEPEYVQDLPGNETRMIQRAAGVPHTIVNGELVIENGAVTGAFPGKVLRRKAREN